jgi:hypothetical protein
MSKSLPVAAQMITVSTYIIALQFPAVIVSIIMRVKEMNKGEVDTVS